MGQGAFWEASHILCPLWAWLDPIITLSALSVAGGMEGPNRSFQVSFPALRSALRMARPLVEGGGPAHRDEVRMGSCFMAVGWKLVPVELIL